LGLADRLQVFACRAFDLGEHDMRLPQRASRLCPGDPAVLLPRVGRGRHRV